MLRSILLALDTSDNSEAVVELGIRWAKQLDAILAGIGVVDQPTMLGDQPAQGTAGDSLELQGHWKDDEQRVEKCLHEFSQRCSDAGVTFKTIKDVGPPADRIVLEANRHDLVMLSPHFHAPTSGGDTFKHVLRSASRPIVSVPKDLPSGGADLKTMAIAFDGGMQASRALYAFVATQLYRSKNVCVISIDDDSQKAARHCALAVDFLRLHDVEAETRPLKSTGTVTEQMLAEVVAIDAELLVLGGHKKSTLQEIFLGSVTKSILHECAVPLFLFH